MASEGAVEGVETTKIELELAGASATLAHVRDEFAMTAAMKKKNWFKCPHSIVQTLEKVAHDLGDCADK